MIPKIPNRAIWITILFALSQSVSAVVTFTAWPEFPNSVVGEGADPGATRGWEFNVVEPEGVMVTHLGLFDYTANGLTFPHRVGIWNSLGELLVSAEIPSGILAPLDSDGLFRFVSVTPIFLSARDNYRIGAQYFDGDSNDLVAIQADSFEIDPALEYVRGVFERRVDTLTYPTEAVAAIDPSAFGPSFQIAPIPEPSGVVYLGVSAIALLRSRHCRTRHRSQSMTRA